MQKYIDTKEEYPGCILFYRLGDFYEMFFEDAVTVSRELELTLTGKSCGLEERAPMCGVPYHAVDGYLNRLVAKGYKVAICEQTEDPKQAKGLVRREVVRVVTPGTILDSQMMDALCRAAKSGIDVKIIMPGIPDKKYAFALAKTYYKELIKAGVKIYEFTPGFVHAKIFVSDNDTATIGTINLDYRSLYLHFECGVFLYNNPVVWDVEQDFQNTLKQCRRISVADLKKIGLGMSIMGRSLRMIAPLM